MYKAGLTKLRCLGKATALRRFDKTLENICGCVSVHALRVVIFVATAKGIATICHRVCRSVRSSSFDTGPQTHHSYFFRFTVVNMSSNIDTGKEFRRH